MKKFIIIMILVLSSTLFLIGCGEESPASTTAPTTEEAEVITIRYASMDAETSWTAQHSTIPWTQEVERVTNGRVKVEVYWSNTLCSAMDIWESVKSGVADAGDMVMAFWPGVAPLSDVISLPLLGIETAEQGSAVFWRLYEQYPAIQDEYKDIHLMFTAVSDPNVLITSSKQVKTVADMRGMKFRVTGGPPTSYMEALSASPMLVAMVDVYTNLQKGVIDGTLAAWPTVQSMSFHEVTKYVTNVPVYSTFCARGMNLNVWNSLPSDIQEALNSINGFERSVIYGKTQFDDHSKVVREDLKSQGVEMIEHTPSSADLVEWQEAALPVWQKWVEDMEALGHSEAQDILDSALELLETYRP